jgi:hypothetical protein
MHQRLSPANENKLNDGHRERALLLLHPSSLPQSGQRQLQPWLGVFISAPAKGTPTRIELYPREFVFCPYRGLRGEGLRIVERRYGHVNPFRTDFVLDQQRRATTRGERAESVCI